MCGVRERLRVDPAGLRRAARHLRRLRRRGRQAKGLSVVVLAQGGGLVQGRVLRRIEQRRHGGRSLFSLFLKRLVVVLLFFHRLVVVVLLLDLVVVLLDLDLDLERLAAG